VIVHSFITEVLNDGHSITASIGVVRDVWPIGVGHSFGVWGSAVSSPMGTGVKTRPQTAHFQVEKLQ